MATFFAFYQRVRALSRRSQMQVREQHLVLASERVYSSDAFLTFKTNSLSAQTSSTSLMIVAPLAM